MHLILLIACAFFSIASVKAVYREVGVGVETQFDFQPHYVTGVKIGDILSFTFTQTQNHSIYETTPESPCTPKLGGINGTAPWETPPHYYINVLDIAPMYFASLEGNGSDCSKYGMVFIKNPPNPKTWDEFHAKAMGKG